MTSRFDMRRCKIFSSFRVSSVDSPSYETRPRPASSTTPLCSMRGRLLSLDAPQHRLDAGEQHSGIVGLGHVVVGTQVHAHDLVELAVGRGEHDDGNLAGPPYVPAYGMPAGPRQLQVKITQSGSSAAFTLGNPVEVRVANRGHSLQLEQTRRSSRSDASSSTTNIRAMILLRATPGGARFPELRRKASLGPKR